MASFTVFLHLVFFQIMSTSRTTTPTLHKLHNEGPFRSMYASGKTTGERAKAIALALYDFTPWGANQSPPSDLESDYIDTNYISSKSWG